MKVSVIGAGSWGTVLAQILDDNGHDTALWVRNKAKAQRIAESRCNADYLPSLQLAPSITITNDLDFAVGRAGFLVLVVPSAAMEMITDRIATISSCRNKNILSCTKGFDSLTPLRMSQIIEENLPEAKNIAVLSGPNLAGELAKRQPGATVIACDDELTALEWQTLFFNHYFRPYISHDVIGVELCGCLKNAIALVSGMMYGLGFGENCQAALITRGLSEITRLGMKLGAQRSTFYGLSGIGDLVATCTSQQSRNRRAGEALAQGKTLKDVLAATHMVVEGVNTVKLAKNLAEVYHADMPIVNEAYRVLFENKDVKTALAELMDRKSKKEG